MIVCPYIMYPSIYKYEIRFVYLCVHLCISGWADDAVRSVNICKKKLSTSHRIVAK